MGHQLFDWNNNSIFGTYKSRILVNCVEITLTHVYKTFFPQTTYLLRLLTIRINRFLFSMYSLSPIKVGYVSAQICQRIAINSQLKWRHFLWFWGNPFRLNFKFDVFDKSVDKKIGFMNIFRLVSNSKTRDNVQHIIQYLWYMYSKMKTK